MGPGSPTPAQTARATDGGSSPMRILRAVEGEGESVKTEEFEIPAVFLTVSEVLEPMSGNSDFLKTDDNVIELRDSIASVRALVDWMIRKKGFRIDGNNWKALTILSDKYCIESLHEDLTVYTHTMITAKAQQTLTLWRFAAFYKYRELAAYCLTSAIVLELLREIIILESRPRNTTAETLESLMARGYMPEAIGDVTRKLLAQGTVQAGGRCIGCSGWPSKGRICISCRSTYG